MEYSSSSKVTVEYHDPSGVFPLIARELANRLPLRNLNWQSIARPLRQIKHLHVEFVPDAETESILRPTSSIRANAEKPTSLDILRSGIETQKGHGKERRHQIPGLKTTPYLRVYILRCDDKNWYKQEERQKLKEWLREILPGDGKQEQHDAFQWLIVHVVIPDTIAASEPRWRESTRDPDELKERSKGSNAKWPGKPSKTVFDRLRSDFNDNKADGIHIAQIRLSKSQVSVDLLPVPATARTLEETADEREKSWNDLMTKIRTSILSSFDARVRQYEEDIAEQEARQSLPGWNFCTFFIHKEGLARALESVGLLEDALTIYDELALGLETIIVDLAAGRASQTATSFPPTGSEIIDRILGSTKTNGSTDVASAPSSRRLFAKDYRQEIVRSAVSTFDFFCYLFDRQTALILRLAGRSTSSKSESGIRENGEDLVMLAEICWRGLSFIHNGARTLKQDLYDSDKDLSSAEVESLVTSWTFSAADFVLDRTQSAHLDLTDAGIKSPGKLPNGRAESPQRRANFGFSMGGNAHPARTSSLPTKKSLPRASEGKSVASTSSAGRISEDGLFSPPSSSGGDEFRPEIPGLAELGAYRAELVILKRKMLMELASANGWRAGWSSLTDASPELEGESINPDEVLSDAVQNGHASYMMIGGDAALLLQSKETFNDAFETLTETAIRHYLSATHSKSAEKLMGDLAILRYQEQDYESAATFFQHASPLYQSSGWSYLETKVIALHVDCLERLGRHRECILAASTLVAQTARTLMHHEAHVSTSASPVIASNAVNTMSSWDLSRLISESDKLTEEMTLPLLDFFFDLRTGHEIDHFQDRDGFKYQFWLRHLLDAEIHFDAIKVRLISATDISQEIILRADEPLNLVQGLNSLDVESKITSLGVYMLDTIELRAKKVSFVHSLAPEPKVAPLALAQTSDRDPAADDNRPSLLLFPVTDALGAEIYTARTTALHKSRQIAVHISSGWNDVSSLDIKLKPTSAGLRLHTTDVALEGIELRQDSSFRTGIIQLGSLSKYSEAVIHVRYSLEQAKSELTVKAEIHYRTKAGDFCFLTDAAVPTQLPLDVEVHDIFRQQGLYSTFSVRSIDGVPMLLKNVELKGTKAYTVEAPPVSTAPAVILPGQSTGFAFVTKRQQEAKHGMTKADTLLELVLDCLSANDAIRYTLQAILSSQLAQSDFNAYKRLLLPVLTKRYRYAFNNQDLETAMLLHETKTPAFADLGWFEIIDTLPAAKQRPLSDWLMKWHIEHQRIAIEINTVPAPAHKRFIIAVEVPTLEYLFTVSLDPHPSCSPSSSCLIIGQPLHLRMAVSVSRQWARPEQNKDEPQTFVYDLQINEEVWILGGARRARFSVTPGSDEHAADITLVPIKAGQCTLPTIDIQPVVLVDRDDSSAAALKPVSCETNLMYSGRVYRVIHDRRRVDHVVAATIEAEEGSLVAAQANILKR